MVAHPDPAPSEPTGPTKAPWQGLLRQGRSLLLWLSLALLLRWAVIEPRWIPSGSMLPTLQLQDRVLVEKLRVRLDRELPVGSVVVFHPPPALQAAGYDPQSALIKRLIGQPGDRIAVRDGHLWRNGSRVEPDWAREPMTYTLPEITVPEGQLMVLGDNRNASLDSHLWGTLPREELIGSAVLRYWPLSRFGPIGTASKADPAIRFSATAAGLERPGQLD